MAGINSRPSSPAACRAHGTPATVEYRGSGTISSPCPPSTNECTFSTLTLHSIATNALMRAESYGSWLNLYVCTLSVNTGSGPQQVPPNQAPEPGC